MHSRYMEPAIELVNLCDKSLRATQLTKKKREAQPELRRLERYFEGYSKHI
jgi:hypothetical protein